MTLKRPEKSASVDQGIYGHLTRRNLAELARERGDHAEEAKQCGRRSWQNAQATGKHLRTLSNDLSQISRLVGFSHEAASVGEIQRAVSCWLN